MIVELVDGQGPVVRRPEELNALSVAIAAPLPPAELAAALGPAVRGVDPDHVWLSVDWLRAQAGRDQVADWFARFDAMIAHARDKGWLAADGRAVRAHLDLGCRP